MNLSASQERRWRFEEVAAPQQPSVTSARTRDDWIQRLQQAYAFIADDPATARRRLEAARAEIESARARNEHPNPHVAAYATSLLMRAEAAERRWQQAVAERERRLRERETRAMRAELPAPRMFRPQDA
jgi:hypothetical protein